MLKVVASHKWDLVYTPTVSVLKNDRATGPLSLIWIFLTEIHYIVLNFQNPKSRICLHDFFKNSKIILLRPRIRIRNLDLNTYILYSNNTEPTLPVLLNIENKFPFPFHVIFAK